MDKIQNFFKSLSISKIIMIAAPITVVILSKFVFNRDFKYFITDLSVVSGILSYYISIFLIDSTNKIKNQIKEYNFSSLQLRNNVNKLKENGESLSASLNNFKDILLKIEIEYLKSENIGKDLVDAYDENRCQLATILEDYRVAILKYCSKDFHFDNYISQLYKTRVDQIKRNLLETLREMKSQTQRLLHEIELIPQLDEQNKEI